MSESSVTSRLWINYTNYINIVKTFIRAERTGNWHSHLTTVANMIDLFAITGHIHYAKSARLYLQTMQDLTKQHPWSYIKFAEEGCHSVRRSNRYWAGIWTDLVIEQVHMRALKSRGGVTRRSGMSGNVNLTWTHTMHRCAEIHNAMSELTGSANKTSEQHCELGVARITSDVKDLQIIYGWFTKLSIPEKAELMCISTGLTAPQDSDINCDRVNEIGAKIQQSLDNQTYTSAKVPRKKKDCYFSYVAQYT